jgi:hypothetical protein
MNIIDILKFRNELIDSSVDENDFISPNSVLEYILPSLVETKLIESAEINSFPFNPIYSIAGYNENESGERLQIFLVDSSSVRITTNNDDVIHSKRDNHSNLFKSGLDFIKKSAKRHLNNELQDSDPIGVLYQKLCSAQYIDKIDVIELILLSLSVSVENRGKELTTKRFLFEDEKLPVSFTRKNDVLRKEILVQYKLVDAEYLYQVSISQGNADPLTVIFSDTFGSDVEVLKAAEEINFESYLCVLPATGLANLYRRESSRLLEKNVRSFLNFKVEANKEMRDTIRKSPEKFIAYNNGLTITGSSGDIVNRGGKYYVKSITDFQIVNGGQTTAGIYFSYKDGLDISKINLMAKINIAKDVTFDELNELISKISQYSNTQTKVSKVDLKTSNQELKLIKVLSRSVTAPNQNKWFFDLAKGEFDTLVKLKGSKKKLEKEFPKERRFTKEELGKFHTSWGLTPYLVKLGGVKVFRFFIENISGDGDKRKAKVIDRDFFEDLVAKVILFRELEKLYGSGKSAIGQLRSAVVPYAISSLYLNMDGDKGSLDFNLSLIWKNQRLDDMMRVFFYDLMLLMNDLVKKFAQSDDYGEYSKKEQLWKDISASKELKKFYNSADALLFMKKYGLSKSKNKVVKSEILDFSDIEKMVQFASLGSPFFKRIIAGFAGQISNHQEDKILRIIKSLHLRKDVYKEGIDVIEALMEMARTEKPSLLDNSTTEFDEFLSITYNNIIKTYNNALNSGVSIENEFKKMSSIVSASGAKYPSVFSIIGEKLSRGQVFSLSEVYQASEYYRIKS